MKKTTTKRKRLRITEERPPTEFEIERALIHYLSLKGYFPIKTDAAVGSRYRGKPTRSRFEPGLPDLVVLHPSKPPFFVEVKTDKGKLKPHQEAFISYLRGRGYVVHVVYGFEQAIALAESVD